ncbi:50S ribosomal protein L33 [Candidatus Kuenenbacteria bacterium CG23_combo_of_CG06-09_8_20_14_all_36_9]|nr:MAG: 50S ribosomal protein L33 [Candidatus Kuenenbacteria bacterium CG23_combo_of_CG06-09_8_20_14_all_36_9]
MATKYKEKLIGLECSLCKTINYYSTKNKKTIKEKLQLKKHCPNCKKHTLHKETKVK